MKTELTKEERRKRNRIKRKELRPYLDTQPDMDGSLTHNAIDQDQAPLPSFLTGETEHELPQQIEEAEERYRKAIAYKNPAISNVSRTNILEYLVKEISQGNKSEVIFLRILATIKRFQENIANDTPEQKIAVLNHIITVFSLFKDSDQIFQLLEHNFKILSSFTGQQEGADTQQAQKEISQFWIDSSLRSLRETKDNLGPAESYIILKIFSNPSHHQFLIESILKVSATASVANKKLKDLLDNLPASFVQQEELESLSLLLVNLSETIKEKERLREISEAISEVSSVAKAIILQKRSVGFVKDDDGDEIDAQSDPKQDISIMIYSNLLLYPSDYKDLLLKFLESNQIDQESINNIRDVVQAYHPGQQLSQIIVPIGAASIIQNLDRVLLPICRDLEENRSYIRTFLLNLLALVPSERLDSDLTTLLQEATGIFGYKEILLQELENLRTSHSGDEYGEVEMPKLLSLIKIITSVDNSKTNKDEEIIGIAGDARQRKLASKIRITESGIQANEARNAFLAKQIATIRSRILSSEGNLRALQSQEDGVRSLLAQLDEDFQNNLRRLESAQEALRQFERQDDLVKKERQRERLELEGQIERLTPVLEGLSGQISTAATELDGLRETIRGAQDLIGNLTPEIESLRRQKFQLEREATKLATEKDALEAENAGLQKLNEGISSDVADAIVKARQAGLSVDDLVKLADDDYSVTSIKGERDRNKAKLLLDKMRQEAAFSKREFADSELPEFIPVHFYFESRGGDVDLQRQIDEATYVIKWDDNHQAGDLDSKKHNTMFSIVCVIGKDGRLQYSLVTADERGVYRSFLEESEVRAMDESYRSKYLEVNYSQGITEKQELLTELAAKVVNLKSQLQSAEGGDVELGFNIDSLKAEIKELEKNQKLIQAEIAIVKHKPEKAALGDFHKTQLDKIEDARKRVCVIGDKMVNNYQKEILSFLSSKDKKHNLKTLLEYPEPISPTNGSSIARRTDKATGIETACVTFYTSEDEKIRDNIVFLGVPNSGGLMIAVEFFNNTNARGNRHEVRIHEGFYNDYSLKSKVTDRKLIEEGNKALKFFNVKAIAAVEQEDKTYKSSSALSFEGRTYHSGISNFGIAVNDIAKSTPGLRREIIERDIEKLDQKDATKTVHSYNTDLQRESDDRLEVPTGIPNYYSQVSTLDSAGGKNIEIRKQICKLAKFCAGQDYEINIAGENFLLRGAGNLGKIASISGYNVNTVNPLIVGDIRIDPANNSVYFKKDDIIRRANEGELKELLEALTKAKAQIESDQLRKQIYDLSLSLQDLEIKRMKISIRDLDNPNRQKEQKDLSLMQQNQLKGIFNLDDILVIKLDKQCQNGISIKKDGKDLSDDDLLTLSNDLKAAKKRAITPSTSFVPILAKLQISPERQTLCA